MSNICDYLRWRGDIPICDISPFNEVDDLILTRFSYLNLDLINYCDNITIGEISEMFLGINKSLYRDPNDYELIRLLGLSKRFKNMHITDYINHKDMNSDKQFGAVTIHIDSNQMYLSFIGTDKSILGIKEDANMCFMETIPSEVEGVKYTNTISNKYNKKVRMGGHSKGGNIAIYSSINNSNIWDRIITVRNYDGPGFPKSIINNPLKNKISTYLPEESIVGVLFEHGEENKVIKCNIDGLRQHNIYTWLVNYNSLVKTNNIISNSIVINNTVKEWLTNTDSYSREVFVDTIFKLIDYDSNDTYKDVLSNWIEEIPKIVSNYSHLDSDKKKTINNMLITFIKSFMHNFVRR